MGPFESAGGSESLRRWSASADGVVEVHVLRGVRTLFAAYAAGSRVQFFFVEPQEGGGLRAVVMDFGLAKERKTEPGMAKLTATGIILGTPEFMSPEQIRGKAVDARCDVFALGVIAYECLAGENPFGSETSTHYATIIQLQVLR